jgi:hypothetical protein
MNVGDVASRPAGLDGCWKTWSEQDVDVVIRTDMDNGAMKTRRRFTGTNRTAEVTVTMPATLYTLFMQWFRVNQRQGAKATWVTTPYGTQEAWQFTAPPSISWPNKNAFTASVTMFRGATYP